jgi:hypothetical protein
MFLYIQILIAALAATQGENVYKICIWLFADVLSPQIIEDIGSAKNRKTAKSHLL